MPETSSGLPSEVPEGHPALRLVGVATQQWILRGFQPRGVEVLDQEEAREVANDILTLEEKVNFGELDNDPEGLRFAMMLLSASDLVFGLD